MKNVGSGNKNREKGLNRKYFESKQALTLYTEAAWA